VAKFYQMMLDGGVARGKRLLSASAVRQLTTTQTGDIKTGFTAGMSWGLGFQVVKEPQGVTAMLSPGTFGHGGAYGTQSWADPRTKTIYVLMIQRARLGNSDGSDLRKAFQAAAAAAKETKRDERAGEDLEWHRLRMRDSPVSHSRALFGPSSASGFSAVKKTGR
jgi:CubicO group peptidase (beta-lactamase class C family)